MTLPLENYPSKPTLHPSAAGITGSKRWYVPEALGAEKWDIPCIVKDTALVLRRGAEEVEKGLLGCFNRKIIIEFS